MEKKYLCPAMAVIFLAHFFIFSQDLLAVNRKKRHRRGETLTELIFRGYPFLRGSEESLEHQNKVADDNCLPRFAGRRDLERAAANGYLLPVPWHGGGFYLDNKSFSDRGYGDRRYLTGVALAYLQEAAASYQKEFYPSSDKPRLKITSLVRTQAYQDYLIYKRRNPSAARGETPERRSAHLTGYAFDVSIKGLTRRQIFWLARYFGCDVKKGLIWGTYEPNGGDFHIMVMPPSTGSSIIHAAPDLWPRNSPE